jgi:predicted Rossmann fold flavoprotein
MKSDAKKQIAVIGAGPAGIMAALQAAQSAAEVHLFESNNKIGKKLLVTGSGRCNITNMAAFADDYHSDDEAVLKSVLDFLPPESFRALLQSMGIFTMATPDGWVYPLSYSAGNVADLLLAQVQQCGIHIHYAAKVQTIQFDEGKFVLVHEKHDAPHLFDALCVACGGKAMPELGSNGQLLDPLAAFGHGILPVKPALAPILFEDKTLRSLDGVRLDVEASLWDGDICLGRDIGNVIFTQWGMNGPAVMNISYLLPEKANTSIRMKINFLAGIEDQARGYIERQRQSQENIVVLLGGFLHQKISTALCKKLGIAGEQPLRDLSDGHIEKIFSLLTSYRVQPTGTRGFKFAQLSSGGIPLAEVEAGTLQSKKQPGLYLAGEVLNVVGPCGGYNLHWAFASGYTAGKSMSREL